MTRAIPTGRHFGLDWLRIGAFAILIGYHTAMYVGPLHWVVKVAHPTGWLAYLLNAISPWRLMVLFAVSGYASAAMMANLADWLAFLANDRSGYCCLCCLERSSSCRRKAGCVGDRKWLSPILYRFLAARRFPLW